MMIETREILNNAWCRLCEYRAAPELILDERDRNNYHGRFFLSQRELLRKSDPTGLCEAMLLLSMAQATIESSQIKLSTLLADDGVITKLRKIDGVIASLMEHWGVRINSLLKSADEAFETFNSEKTKLSLRELTVCLRDAVFSVANDLQWRWLNCDPETDFDAGKLHLSKAVLTFDDFHHFIDAFALDMPVGLFLVHVKGATVFALNVPGRQAYLSALSVCEHLGVMRERYGSAEHGVQSISLDNPSPRYPIWQRNTVSQLRAPGDPEMFWGGLGEIGRDSALWALMVVETLRNQTQWQSPQTIDPAESLRRALSDPSDASLPVCKTPAWKAKKITIKDSVAALRLTSWEQRFFASALSIPDHLLLPTGREKKYLCADTFQLISRKDLARGQCEITPFDDAVIGCRDEIEFAREQVFLSNLRRWLMIFGNTKFNELWTRDFQMLKRVATHNISAIFSSPLAKICDIHQYSTMHSLYLYRQDPKRTGYSPLCMLDQKTLADHVIVIRPDNSAQFAQVLGVQEDALPLWMQGWERNTYSWTTGQSSLYPIWRFVNEPFMVITVAVAKRNLTREFEPVFVQRSVEKIIPGLG